MLILDEYHKWLTKFQGNNVVSTHSHVKEFEDIIYKKDVQLDNVVMKFLVFSLEEDAMVWFRNLKNASAKTWNASNGFLKNNRK